MGEPVLVAAGLLLVGLLILMWSLRRAAGRLAPRVGIGTLFFLMSRWPVMVAWGFGTAGTLLLLAPGLIAKGRDTFPDFLSIAGVSLMCGLGVACIGAGVPFIVIRWFAPAPTFALEPGEQLLDERSGIHFLNGEGRGGSLFVTTRRFGFRSHRFNVQVTPWSVKLEDIQSLNVEGHWNGSGDRFLVVATTARGAPEWLATESPKLVAKYVGRLRECPEADRAQVPISDNVLPA